MSFILDALRKSELERQRDSAPGLMRSPVAAARRETPLWIWLLIVLLSLAVAGLAGAWWLRNRDGGIEAVAEQSPVPPVDTASIGAAPAAATPEGAARAAPTAAATEAEAGAPATDLTGIAGEPLPMADLVRAHPELPRYTLSFLDYNGADPDSGSAWINGQRYYPGQAIVGGPALVGIRPDGAVLAYRGRSFLLTPR